MVLYDDDDGVHVSRYVWFSNLWRKSHTQRVALLQCRQAYPVASYLLAIVTLQRLFRGIIVRRRVIAKYVRRTFIRKWKVSEQQLRRTYSGLPAADPSRIADFAQRVQARWRAVLMKSEFERWLTYERHTVYYVAAAVLQKAWTSYRQRTTQRMLRRRTQRVFLSKEDSAAGKIQLAFRSYSNRQIFRFYVDLIRFRERGDPKLMLRCINPLESGLFDSASGLHVRFRLGGSQFPPTVYYKIFVHGNVADVGAMAPKDYVRVRQRKAADCTRNNKSSQRGPQDRTGWYRRDDFNNWRPVNDSVLRNAEQIVKRLETQHLASSKALPESSQFHYSKLKREDDRHRKVKQRRRDWLVQLYTQEQLEKQTGALTSDVRGETAQHAQHLFGKLSDEDIDREVQRLVQWTHDLDFAKYRSDWLSNATSAATDTNLASAASVRTL
eukprot:PhM_4_TR7421/c0_g1_i1/m.37431